MLWTVITMVKISLTKLPGSVRRLYLVVDSIWKCSYLFVPLGNCIWELRNFIWQLVIVYNTVRRMYLAIIGVYVAVRNVYIAIMRLYVTVRKVH